MAPMTHDELLALLAARKKERRLKLQALQMVTGSEFAMGPRDEDAFTLWETLEVMQSKEVAEMVFYDVIPRWVGVHRLAGTPPWNSQAFALTCNIQPELVVAAKDLLDLKEDVCNEELSSLLQVEGPLAGVLSTILARYRTALHDVDFFEAEEMARHRQTMAAIQTDRYADLEGYGPISDVLWALHCPPEDLPDENEALFEFMEGEGPEAAAMRRADLLIQRRLKFARASMPDVSTWEDWKSFAFTRQANGWRLPEEDAEAMAAWRRGREHVPQWLEAWQRFRDDWAEWRKKKAAEEENGKAKAVDEEKRKEAAAGSSCRTAKFSASQDIEELKSRPSKKPSDSSSSRTGIHDLPDDCLVEVFRRLYDEGRVPFFQKDLRVYHPLHCSLVCKRWWSLADKAVHTVQFPIAAYGKGYHAKVVAKALPRWTNLIRLDLGDYVSHRTSAKTFDVVRELPLLQHLAVSYFSDNLPLFCAKVDSIKQLTSLELVCSQLPPLSEGQFGKVLKTLELRNFGGDHVPDSLGLLTGLESLSVKSSLHLKSLPNTISSLLHLTSLEVSKCGQLDSLPSTLGQLASLKHLGVQKVRTWPDSFGRLQTLEALLMSECYLPEGLSQLTGLQHLSLFRSRSHPDLLCSLSCLSSLESISIMDCHSLRLFLPALGMLSGLKELDIRWDEGLEALPDSLRHLTTLETCSFSYLSSLQRLPEGISEWRMLTTLEIMDCKSLEALPEGLGQLRSLRELWIADCKSLTSIPQSIGELRCLEDMCVNNCPQLMELPDRMKELSALRRLHVSKALELPEGLAQRRDLQVTSV